MREASSVSVVPCGDTAEKEMTLIGSLGRTSRSDQLSSINIVCDICSKWQSKHGTYTGVLKLFVNISLHAVSHISNNRQSKLRRPAAILYMQRSHGASLSLCLSLHMLIIYLIAFCMSNACILKAHSHSMSAWKFNLSFPWVSLLFLNSWRVNRVVPYYVTTYHRAIQIQHWHPREAQIEPSLFECEWAFRIQAYIRVFHFDN
jgi:hypothetical protein